MTMNVDNQLDLPPDPNPEALASTLPDRDVAWVTPNLREQYVSTVPPERRAAVDWRRQSLDQVFADQPVSQRVEALLDSAGWAMHDTAAGETLPTEDRDKFSATGWIELTHSIARETGNAMDRLHSGVEAELHRYQSNAEETLSAHAAAMHKASGREQVARSRVREALSAGDPGALVGLLDAAEAAGDRLALGQLTSTARAQIAALPADKRLDWRDVGDVLDEAERRSTPPEVVDARATIEAVAGARRRLESMRRVVRR